MVMHPPAIAGEDSSRAATAAAKARIMAGSP
jgi:hypothetical protein